MQVSSSRAPGNENPSSGSHVWGLHSHRMPMIRDWVPCPDLGLTSSSTGRDLAVDLLSSPAPGRCGRPEA